MLTVVCGEDSVSSRKYYSDLRKSSSLQGLEIFDVKAKDINEILSWLSDSQSLFFQKKVFFTESLNRLINKRTSLKFLKVIDKLIKLKNIELVDYESEISSRWLRLSKGIVVKEFKLRETIFKLLDACFPKNLRNFSQTLNELVNTVDENIVFYMLTKHIRNLIMAKNKLAIPRLQTWQIAKLRQQAYYWDNDKLIKFYEGLHKIDISTKTSTNPYSLKKSLDMLACYFL